MEGRGAYYQEAGALRDMMQNHLLQVMATVAMEPSATFSADAVRDERAKLLRSIRVMKPEEVAANSGGRPVRAGASRRRGSPGFRQEKGVDPDSQTDTFAAVDFLRRQLALGGRAVLHPHRQVAAEARHRDRHPIQLRAARLFRNDE